MSLNLAISGFIIKPEFRDHNHQLEYYRSLSFERAVDDAVFGGRYIGEDGLQYLSNHYWKAFETISRDDQKAWPSRLVEARRRLLGLQTTIENQADFESLYSIIRNALEHPKIPNLGDLYYYDVALRIGFVLKPILLPNQLFVQSGSERGAKDILGDDIYESLKANNPYISPEPLYQIEGAFQKLEVHQIESFLCVMKDEIKEWLNSNNNGK